MPAQVSHTGNIQRTIAGCVRIPRHPFGRAKDLQIIIFAGAIIYLANFDNGQDFSYLEEIILNIIFIVHGSTNQLQLRNAYPRAYFLETIMMFRHNVCLRGLPPSSGLGKKSSLLDRVLRQRVKTS